MSVGVNRLFSCYCMYGISECGGEGFVVETAQQSLGCIQVMTEKPKN